MLRSALAHARPVQIGPYLLSECIGQGGMAVVYRATRTGPAGFEKTLVVKCMLPGLTTRKDLVDLFYAEARLSAQLNHPNIVQVHDFGVEEGVPYLVMEYLNGRNLTQLRNLLRAIGRRLPVGAAVAIAREMSHALAYAHEFTDERGARRQVIHRDVSPSNVVVCRDGTVKLLDFGVAKVTGAFDCEVTQSFRGKYAYMAPEQVNREPIDRRVDVFAAGIVLHEMLTGRRLFHAQSEFETLERVAAAQVVAPSVDNPDVPRALDAVVKRALARDAAARYGSGAELAAALDGLEGLGFSRGKLAACLNELLPVETAICDVCGKSVVRGEECGECGTLAPLHAVFEPDEPRELPPAPACDDAAHRLPPRLQVVRTPLPDVAVESPFTDPVDLTPIESLSDAGPPPSSLPSPFDDEPEPTPVEDVSEPRRLVLVPPEEAAEWNEDEISTQQNPKLAPVDSRPYDSRPYLVEAPRVVELDAPFEPPAAAVPNFPSAASAEAALQDEFDLRPKRDPRLTAAMAVGALIGVLALGIGLLVRSAPAAAPAAPTVRALPSASIVTPLAGEPIAKPAKSIVATAPAKSIAAPAKSIAAPAKLVVAPAKPVVVPAKAIVALEKPIVATKPIVAPTKTIAPRPVAAAAVADEAPVAPRPRRVRPRAEAHGTVKEGRIVDPFAGVE